jgi:N-acetylneuraminic acid mutarotase
MSIRLLYAFICFTNTLISQTWLQLADFPGLKRDDGVAVTVNNLCYFGTGLKDDWTYGNDFYVLNTTTNSWTTTPAMPSGQQRQYACAFAGLNSFFVFGGDGISGSLNNLYKFDITSTTWSALASKPGNGVVGATCFEFGNKVIIVGGKFQGNQPAINEVWEYDIGMNVWTQKNNFPFGGRFRASGTVINNVGYLMFGLDENNRFRKEMYGYNQSADSWTKILDFPQALGRAYSSLKAIDNKLILFGGYDSLNTYYQDVWCYDIANTNWTQTANFSSFGRKGGMSTVVDNKFYYSCGINSMDVRLNETWVLELPVGIKENIHNNKFLLYPNPVEDFFILQSFNHFSDVTVNIINALGDEVKHIHINSPNSLAEEVNVDDLKAGIYTLKIYEENKWIETKRLIKK